MLNLAKLAAGPGAGRYYVDQVALGAEDYYAGGGEAPGRWIGGGAALLDLAGEVDEDGIVRLLEARDPGSGEPLRRPLSFGAVGGFDLTFKAPKSVSLLFGIADELVREQVRAAHAVAVADALGYLEREACRTRRGAGGATVVEGGGFVAAAFEHRTSRAGDPLLHTHVVVGNVTRGPDGRWTALDGRALYWHQKAGGYLYQARLRAELTERLVVRWQAVERGAADLAGIDRGVIEHFSRRRAEILEHMAARGEHSAQAAEIAALETRKRKRDVPIERLREQWRARAAEHGLTRVRVRSLLGRTRAHTIDPEAVERLARRLEGAEGMTRESSSFTRREVVMAFAEAAGAGATVSEIEARAEAFLGREQVVELEPVTGARRYTTRELLAVERELLDGSDRRRDGRVAVAVEAEVEAVLAARPSLTDEQRTLVRALAGSGAGVQVVRAAAGTGKTRALDGARDAWQHRGVPVLGCALSARAACELRDGAGIDATTIARLTYGLERGVELAPGAVLVVDEAGMVGTRDLAKLARAVDAADGKLVLVGDDRQLPEIDAGGAFRALADRLGAVELHEVHRQREGWDRDALAALRGGDVERFVREYQAHGRIVAAPTADAVKQALVQDWWKSHQGGERALMIAHRRTDVADLNQRARERMREDGRLGPDKLATAERSFAEGDRVVTTRNDRRLDVVNGQTGTIKTIGRGRVEIDLDRGTRIALPDHYAREHLDHAYATTAHRAQGATVERSFVLGSDELYREWGYTALSRHEQEARFYVTASSRCINQRPEPLRTIEDVSARVRAMLTTSRAEHLASDTVLEGTTRALDRSADDARAQLAETETRLEALKDQRDQTRWYQRRARGDIDRTSEGWLRARGHWREQVDRLAKGAEPRRPQPPEPQLERAHDPLARLDPAVELARQQALERTPQMPGRPLPTLDRGIDLGL